MIKFTLLMSIYKLEKPNYLNDCLASIVSQTLPPDEFIVVEDGPLTTELSNVLDNYENKLPIKRIKLEKNSGLAKALNIGLNYCSHSIIVRMDSDDICLPGRFEEQIDYFVKNPETSVISSWIEECDENMLTTQSIKKLPSDNESIKKFSKLRSPIAHPACAYKKNDVLSVGGYPHQYPEDYGLWIKMIAHGYQFHNIQKVLLKMRCGDNMLKRRGANFLIGEIKTHYSQYKLGTINLPELSKAVLIKIILRTSPFSLRKIFYKKLR